MQILPSTLSGWLALLLGVILFATTLAAGGRPFGIAAILSLEATIWSIATLATHGRARRVIGLLGWWSLLMAWGVFSATFVSAEPIRSLISLSVLIGPLLLIPAVTSLGAWSDSQIRGLLNFASLGCLVWMSLGLVFVLWPDNPVHEWMWSQPWQHGEPFSTIDYQGNAGTLITFSGICIASAGIGGSKRWWFGLLIVLAAAVLNASRTTLLLAPASIVATILLGSFVTSQRQPRFGATFQANRGTFFLVAIGILVATGFGAWLSDGMQHTAATRFGHLKKDLAWPYYPRRLEMLAAARNVAYRPILGWGPGMYASVAANDPDIGRMHFAMPPPPPGNALKSQDHAKCDPLELCVDWGIPGALWLVLPFLAATAMSIRDFRDKHLSVSQRLLGLTIFMSLGAVGLNGIIDCPLALPVILALTATLCGMGLRSHVWTTACLPSTWR